MPKVIMQQGRLRRLRTAAGRQAYVVMPFASRYEELYETGIRPAALHAGLAVARYDEIACDGDVGTRIAHGIRTADLLVAVVTGRNANVFYEIGFARAIGKPIVVVASARDEIPAFLEDLPCIVYGACLIEFRTMLTGALQCLACGDAQTGYAPHPSLMAHR